MTRLWSAEKPDWWRWYDDPFIRRFHLARWSFRNKHWHPKKIGWAKLRSVYWVVLRGHDSEICGRCGNPVRLVFHVPDKLWEAYAGFPWSNARRDYGGEAAPGVLCPVCFDDLAREAGAYLCWTCSTDDGIMRG